MKWHLEFFLLYGVDSKLGTMTLMIRTVRKGTPIFASPQARIGFGFMVSGMCALLGLGCVGIFREPLGTQGKTIEAPFSTT